MRHLICIALMALAGAPLAAEPAAPADVHPAAPPVQRPPIPISLLRIGEQFYSPTPPRRLTEGETITSLAFSPSGDRIAFVSVSYPVRTLDTERAMSNPLQMIDEVLRGRVAVVDVRTRAVRELLAFPVKDGAWRGLAIEPNTPLAFSADGLWLTAVLEFIDFEAEQRGESTGEAHRIAVFRVSDGNTRWLSVAEPPSSISRRADDPDLSTPARERRSDWHPSRSLLAYPREVEGEKVIALWNAETGTEQVVAPGIAPKWSADGGTLDFIRAQRDEERTSRDESGRPFTVPYRLQSDAVKVGYGTTTPTPRPRAPSDDIGRWTVKTTERRGAILTEPLVVVDREGNRETVVASPGPGGKPRPLQWNSDGTLLLYAMTSEIADAARARAKGFVLQYWVYNAAETTQDCTTLVAIDAWYRPEDLFRGQPILEGWAYRFAAWSPRGRQIAFVRDGDLWLTDLEPAGTFGVPSMSLGMTEIEARQVAMRKMQQIARAARKYADVHDGALPTGARLEEELRPYLDDPDALYLPTSPGTLGFDWWSSPG